MRLWHKDLIPVLPKQQLLGQWRECCAIAKNISEKGYPNHILVNPILDYPISHFRYYAYKIYKELKNRGNNPDRNSFCKWMGGDVYPIKGELLFENWHTQKYLTQCLANLEEKHDRGGISDEEWTKILHHVSTLKKGA